MWVPRVSRGFRAAFGARSGFPGGAPAPPPATKRPEGAGSCSKKVTLELLDHLEHLALVDFRNWEGVERLEKAIEFADQLHSVPTDGIEPMDSVLEDRHLYLREDNITEGNCAEELLKAAKLTIEDYFMAPPELMDYNLTVQLVSLRWGEQGNTCTKKIKDVRPTRTFAAGLKLSNIPLPKLGERESFLKKEEP